MGPNESFVQPKDLELVVPVLKYVGSILCSRTVISSHACFMPDAR